MITEIKNKIKNYITKNYKKIIVAVVILLLIFTNVKQYQKNTSIYSENQRINIEYINLKNKISEKDFEITSYQNKIKEKDFVIDSSKNEIKKTENKLSVSQNTVKNLSTKILNNNINSDTSKNLTNYIKDCDSLALISPILSNQIDTLKTQNQELVKTITEKSILQDSIIKRKDGIILDQTAFLNNTVESYNKSVIKLESVEKKLSKEKKRKSFWKKTAIGIGVGIVGIFSLK